ncbi:MAG: GMC family oxidoreductase N-terminal domain-containing protein [Arenicellales bacterium]|nr:GMC family oxidoreductase N-terminal domain-containing protein [Arenicellales bacterium]
MLDSENNPNRIRRFNIPKSKHNIVIVGGGTAGSVLASRLSEDPNIFVTLLEAGPGHEAYDSTVLEPINATDVWTGEGENVVSQAMASRTGSISMIQNRMLGGTSAANGLATLRGQPADYDSWAEAGLTGWSWEDVKNTFIAAERDIDFGNTPIHGGEGPLPVRRWRRDELAHGQAAFFDGMIKGGQPVATDINDPSQLPGIGIFPVTIDEQAKRVSTSLAYLTDEVVKRDNIEIRTRAEVAKIEFSNGRATGVLLANGEEIEADEIVVTAGAIWTPTMLLRSGVGPKAHLAEYGIKVHADLSVGSTMSDHIGTGIPYWHDGPRGGSAGPAQVVLVGASNGKDIDYHVMPVSIHNPETNPLTFKEKARLLGSGSSPKDNNSKNPSLKTVLSIMKFFATPTSTATMCMLAVFLLRSSGRGSVRLGNTPEADPKVVAPPLPEDAPERLRHAFDQIAIWEQSDAFKAQKLQPILPHDLSASDAVSVALERNTISYGHMVGTCPMGPVLDTDCRVHGIPNLRVADASVMPTIPCGNTYLGCVMVAERIASKMKAEGKFGK